MVKNDSKMAKNYPKWPEMVINDLKWWKIAKKYSKMAKMTLKWQKMAKNDQKWPKMVPNCLKILHHFIHCMAEQEKIIKKNPKPYFTHSQTPYQ